MGFRQLEQRAQEASPKRIAVVCAHDRNALAAVGRAAEKGIARAVLIGDEEQIREKAAKIGVSLEGHVVTHETDPESAAKRAMSLVNDGGAQVIMKGKTTTASLMHVAIRDGIRREGRLLSHVAGFEHPKMGEDRLMILTDAGLVPFPTLEQRVQIIKNAVEVARSFGTEQPRVAVLSLTEEVSETIPISVEAVRLKEMNAPGGPLEGFGIIDGPMDLFAAVDAEIAALKGVNSEVAGAADILHCPNVVCGNLMSKAVIYFADESRTGGVVVGGKVPVILLSRASSAEDKYCSLLLGISCSSEQ